MTTSPEQELALTIVKFLVGGGAVAVTSAIGRVIYKWRTGRIAAERISNTSLVNQRLEAIEERREAETERDVADAKRILWMEECSRLRRLLIENGIDPGEKPDIERTIERPVAPVKPPRRRKAKPGQPSHPGTV